MSLFIAQIKKYRCKKSSPMLTTENDGWLVGVLKIWASKREKAHKNILWVSMHVSLSSAPQFVSEQYELQRVLTLQPNSVNKGVLLINLIKTTSFHKKPTHEFHLPLGLLQSVPAQTTQNIHYKYKIK